MERLQTKPDYHARLNRSYTDQVLSRNWLNSLLLKSNMAVLLLYRNLTNASLFSRTTKASRDMFEESVLRAERLQNTSEVSLNVTDQQHLWHNTRTNSLDANFIATSTASGTGLKEKISNNGSRCDDSTRNCSSQKPATTHSDQTARSSKTKIDSPPFLSDSNQRLRIPKRRNILFATLMAFEIILTVRYFIVLYALSDSVPRQPLVSCANKVSLRNILAHVDEPIRIEYSSQISNECRQRLERFLTDRYGGFRVWNVSVGILFDVRIWDEFLLIEQDVAIQALGQETKVVVYLLILFIVTIGLVGCIIAGQLPYDVTALVLIYDPRFLAFNVQSRLYYYLNLMRRSYLNYWNSYGLSADNRLCTRATKETCRYYHCRTLSSEADFSPQVKRCSKNSKSDSGADKNVVDCVSLNYQHYEDYMPTSRSQSWRHFLIMVNPIIHLSLFAFVVTLISTTFILSVGMNETAASLNKELALFLESRNSIQGLEAVQKSNTCNGQLNNLTVIQEALVNLIRPYIPNQRNSLGERLMFPKDLARLLGPTRIPSLYNWLFPFLAICVTAALATAYISIFLVTILDLCFWLLELRIKLHVCTLIVKNHDIKSRLSRRNTYNLYEGGSCQLTQSQFNYLKDLISQSMNSTPDSGLTKRFVPDLSDNQAPHESSSYLTYQDVGWSPCNVGMSQVMSFLIADRPTKIKLCESYAHNLIEMDFFDSASPRRTTDKFLTSTYLDFRLFQDQIDSSRITVNVLITYTVIHALNLVISSILVDNITIKMGLILAAFMVANLTLIGSSFFQSQCSKLHYPIFSILAASTEGGKTIRHLASLWRRILVDISGSRSKFSFRVYSFNVSYATTLQVSVTWYHQMSAV